MKRKKIFFILLILFIGIGFAILSSNLSILSNLTIADASWNVYLYRPEIMDTNTEGNTYTLSTDNIELSLTSNLDKPGDYVVYDFYVINDGTIDAELNNLSIAGLDSSYIDYSLTYYSGNTINDNDILKSKSSKRLKLFISYKYDVDSFINVSSISATISFKYIQPEYSENVWDYDYTDDIQTFTAPKSGTYKLEVWGAQGGTGIYSLNGVNSNQGYGGYSSGEVSLNKDEQLYLLVGEAGKGAGFVDIPGTFNGGGSAVASLSSYMINSSGGGGTSIFKSSDVLHYNGKDIANLNYTSGNGQTLSDEDLVFEGDSFILKYSGNYNLFQGGNSKKSPGSHYKIIWRGVGLNNSKLSYDGGIYDLTNSYFKLNKGVTIYDTNKNYTMSEIYYEITEENKSCEFRLQTNGQSLIIHSKTIIKLDDPLIVSGGGGGAHLHGNGQSYAGSGGGYIGSSPVNIYQRLSDNCSPGTGGSQTSAGIIGLGASSGTAYFGKGGNYTGWKYGAGGGGGYYGGAPGIEGNSCAFSGAGGSGYIGNESLSNKVMYCYNCAESSNESTKTISTTNVSETPISNYAKIGNGYARITYLG